MSINSSSSLGDLPPPFSPSNSSTSPFYMSCQHVVPKNVMFTTYTAINACLLPLYSLVLLMGLQRCRHHRSAGTTMSHSDFFTFNMMVPEIICVFGSMVFVLGSISNKQPVLLLGLYLYCIIFPGQSLFHVLTCVDRYLAVTHPIAYLNRRETYGVVVRNISTVCVWLLCVLWLVLMKMYLPNFPTVPFFSCLSVCVFIILSCCLSVLCALTRPGPGQVDDHRVDQSKRRAFYMILAITVTLQLRFVGLLVSFGLKNGIAIDLDRFCLLLGSAIFLIVPSSLVLPLLFLHRDRKLLCCRKDTDSE